MNKASKVRLKGLKKSGYKCPICNNGDLVEINAEKDFGDVNIEFKTRDGIGFKFHCKIKNDYFFLCTNENCRARIERTRWYKGEKMVGPPCPTINCNGSLNTDKNIPIAKVYPKKGEETVALTYGKNEPIFFEISSGQLSYDEAGICTQCHYVTPKEIDLK